MRPPFAKATDYLQVGNGQFIAGQDSVDYHTTFYDLSQFNLQNQFSMPGSSTIIYGDWESDSGDLQIALADREPRTVADQGKATVTFIGTNLILRYEVDYGWGIGSIYIDGVQPSTIAGLTTAINTVNFNSTYYGENTPTQYMEILVADGLTSGTHTLDIYANNPTDQSVSIVGIKSRSFAIPPVADNSWHTPHLESNYRTLYFYNGSADSIMNISATFSSPCVNTDGSAITTPFTISDLASGSSSSFNYALSDIAQDTGTTAITIVADYVDPSGTVPIEGPPIAYGVHSNVLTFTGAWNIDDPGQGEGPDKNPGAYSVNIGDSCTFTMPSASFTATLLQDYGWGSANVIQSGVTKGTLTCNNVNQSLVYSYQTISGLTPNVPITIQATTKGSSAPFVFKFITFSSFLQYSTVTYDLNFNLTYAQVPPMAPANVRLENGKITWDPVDFTQNVGGANPRDNSDVTGVRIYARFPIFCTNYSPSFPQNMEGYDILLIDPYSYPYAKVKEWQAKGVIVIGYVTFGEEDCQPEDLYDGDSPTKPLIDDGLGTGGYASYYNKGGNLYGERNECQFDQQRVDGIKRCAKSRAEYFTALGRCSNSCENDWRDGYRTQSVGGKCLGGYTAANNWQRDPDTACTNTSCPKYTPRNKNCPMYSAADTWGQSFSMSDTYPDQNGTWDSSYINPLMPRWKEKLSTQFVPTVLNEPVSYTNETHTLAAYTSSKGVASVVFRLTNYPIDLSFAVTLVRSTGQTIPAGDYYVDDQRGAVIIDPKTGVDAGLPNLVAGNTVTISYTRKGLGCDGIIMDTIDTVDIYPSQEFAKGMSDMINSFKLMWPTKIWGPNRGFTVWADVVKSCGFVMLESTMSDSADNDSGESYYQIDQNDPEIEGFNTLLAQTRATYTFDVVAQNYCSNAPSDNYLREFVMNTSYAHGYMGWTSVIDLNHPLPPASYTVPGGGLLQTTDWTLIDTKAVDSNGNSK